MQGDTGTSSLTVTDTTASSVAVISKPSAGGPFVQNLTITGATVLNRNNYPAVYMFSEQPGWDANLRIDPGVTITSAGPFGAVWLRSESKDPNTSNTITVDSAATVMATGADTYGITATSNNGAVSLINRGTVTSTQARGLYADGGSDSSAPVIVSITNLGTVNSYQAGARAIDWLGTAMIDNRGSVRASTFQGLITWSANGGSEINNSGSVVAEHYNAVVAAGTGGNVIVNNSGSITASRNLSLADVAHYYGISADTDGSGTVSVTNSAGGTISAAYDAGIYAASSLGAISIANIGRIDAQTGLFAESSGGQVSLVNSGSMTTSSVGIRVDAASGGSVINSGTIASAATAFQVADGVAVDVENRSGALAIGGLQLGSLANFNNAGDLVLKQGASLATYASTGSAISSRIGGNFVQSSNGSLNIAADSSASYSSLAVGGTASLGGTLNVDLKSTYAGGDLTDVVSAAGGVTNSGLRVSDNSLRYAFATLFRANGVDLVAQDTGMTTIRAAVSPQSPGALGAASILDDLLANGTSSVEFNQALQGILDSNSASEVTGKVQQTLPLLTGNSMNLANNTLGSVNSVIQSRVDVTRGLSSGDTFFGDRHLWMKPFATRSRQDNRDGVVGYSADTNGFVIGADGSVAVDTDLGLALAYAKTDVSSNSAGPKQSADIDTYQFILYGRHALDADTDLLFQLDAGQLRNDGKRQIDLVGLSAESSYDSKTAHAGIGLDRRFQLSEHTTFKPSLRLDYTWVEDEAYREKGAGDLNLQVKSRSTDALVLGLDGLLSHALTDQLSVTGNLGAGYDFYNRDASITAAYAGAPQAAFVTEGSNQSAWSQHAGAGLIYTSANGTEITGRYDAQHREGFLSQTASVQLRWMF
ncbi:MAG: autotransporter domain-containing protein [Pseudomonas sp.]|uniref:autotransporter outer membrane beta-barrel domain-containing protein n=1 Tax=Pseudomonas sp. TaxID=306 RepID=UPI00398260DC